MHDELKIFLFKLKSILNIINNILISLFFNLFLINYGKGLSKNGCRSHEPDQQESDIKTD
jgi:hypothetical protein